MRQIVLDTETTGLEPSAGHRIIEIGCVELVNRRLTGNHYQQFLNPDREIDEGATEVHGIRTQDLIDKPHFADVAEDFINFIRGAELIIHNAPFDVGFINHELQLMEATHGKVDGFCTVLDTLKMAREIHPGQKNNLDALCKRYYVNNSRRELHGALLDAEILADVYLAMTGGQTHLSLGGVSADSKPGQQLTNHPLEKRPSGLRIIHASDEEVNAHNQRLDLIDKASNGQCVWKRLSDS
ncbi:MAG: DNA polymerase III subunit epsilon [Gammaproteobacteria bacterium]|nr:DNA polymerase III subunit epsilon [Gammaproteobacteria bacterium]